MKSISGVFTVPMSGIWTVSVSLAHSAFKTNDGNAAYIYFNGEKIPESEHGTFKYCPYESCPGGPYSKRRVRSSGERKIFLKARAGNTISIQISGEERSYNILTCFEFHY